jgi:N-acetylmuramoyl-L-alanine amidase
MDEKDVNLAIAQETAEALEALGMQVKLIQTDPYLTLTQRIEEARAFQADIFLSIHSNSSVDAGASGTEAFYFYPNSQPLASAISRRVASALDTANRGGKQARYVVTTDSRFASALIECGFISNKNEYRKLTDPSYQREVASGIAEGVRAYIDTISTGITGGQGEELGDRWEDQENSGEGDQLLHLRQTSLSLSVGESFQLQADQTGNAAGEEVFWESDDETVAVVDEEGYVEAVGEGSCIITASIRSGASAATCTLEVLAEKEGSQKISFSETAFTLQLGEGFRIKPETGPKPDKLRFESKDETVVTVDSDGWVEAVGEGETVIHVWEEGADEEHRLAVTVQAPSE